MSKIRTCPECEAEVELYDDDHCGYWCGECDECGTSLYTDNSMVGCVRE